MGPDMHYVDEKPADPLTLDIYPSAKSIYTLYEDDGRSNDYKRGSFARTRFDCETIGADVIVNIGVAQGDYNGKLTYRTYLLKINRKAGSLARITRSGAPMEKLTSKEALDSAEQGWFDDAAGATVWVKFSTSTAIASKIVLNGIAF
jgi:alpha-glucosidase